MATWRELVTARREGSLAAQRMRRRLGLASTRRVEVFEVIDDAGVWLMFQPLRDLYGFYRRIGSNAGIVLNAGHPAAVQRYTAAHEFGHHVLGHACSLDEAAEIVGAAGVDQPEPVEATLPRSKSNFGDPVQEAAAQEFAATFLMPVQMINRALLDADLDRDRPRLSPAAIYTLSLEFGTSYEATVTQLAILGKISWLVARHLRLSPLQIKTDLAGGRRPANSRADLWLVRGRDRDRVLPLRVEDEIVLRLPETPSTGYAWELASREWSTLTLVDERLDAAETDDILLGGMAYRTIHLRAAVPGSDDIVARLTRPWEQMPAEQATFHIDVARAPTGDAANGLLETQQKRLARVA
jgi:predicted secreted protein/Zn-dependent peptidase ImmA (M78 family)